MNLESKTARAKLGVRWKPYWLRLAGGVSLGYRRSQGPGSWSIRLADGKQGNSIRRIATADDVEKADGARVMSFIQARNAVLHWGQDEAGDEQAAVVVTTVADAIEMYADNAVVRGGNRLNANRLRYNLTSAMLARPVRLLTVKELMDWRDKASERLAPSGVNRLTTVLKAALNFAAKREKGLDATVWRDGLASIPGAIVAKNVVLQESTIIDLIHEARKLSPEFGLLVEGLALTGARISQLRRCRVCDLVGDRLMVPSSFKGKGKGKKVRLIPVLITEELAARLRVAAAGKPEDDSLFAAPSGKPWTRYGYQRPFDKAVNAIGRRQVGTYALRHSHITRQLLQGMPVQVVAKLHDTSVAQIESHYAKEIVSHADDMVRASLMRVDRPLAAVVNLR